MSNREQSKLHGFTCIAEGSLVWGTRRGKSWGQGEQLGATAKGEERDE